MTRLPIVVVMACALGACDEDPADVSGTYTVAITNGANGCNWSNYGVGDTNTNIDMVVTQSGENVSADVMGLAGLALDGVVGSHVFMGSVDGNDVHLRITGTRMMSQNTCDYHFDAEVEARLTGDSLAGAVVYTGVTDGSNDCGSLEGCKTIQNFNGSRPPQ